MDPRVKMRKWREKRNVTFDMISDKCGVSACLLSMIENGEVSHPKIIKKIQDLYGLTDREAEELLPENRRLHSKKYDPDKYVIQMTPAVARTMPKQSVIDRYLAETHSGIYVRLSNGTKYYRNRY